MRTRDLGGEWAFREQDGGEWRTGHVPGGVYTDLRDGGEIPDPFYEDNELDVQWVGETDWEYRRTVTVDVALLEHDRVLLQCDGLDTVATVRVNDRVVGESRNMHVGHEFDVAEALEPGDNEIRVEFRSPVEYGIERAEAYPYDVPAIRYPVDQPARQFVRKAQCHYGWDWGPCLPTVGIYRDVSLVAYSEPRVRYTTTEQDHDGDGIGLTVRAGIDAPEGGEYDLGITVTDGDGRPVAETTERVSLSAGSQAVETTVTVEDVDLWWPNGHGDQPLYDLAVTVGDHTATDRVGFRDLDVVVEDDDAGTSFAFEVNGRRIFAKGANTIPVAPLYGDVTRERYEHVLHSAVDANMNTVRVWGGGYYEDDAFYELCDELGLLVWQDFMFACGLYPADEAFLETVGDEVRYQVRRLANHPSIALWCGNNENEEALYNWFGDHDHHDDHVADYRALYEETVAPACREEDPGRTYWPGSPSSGPGTDDPYDADRGDIHYWDVWHAGRPFEDYYTTEPRFVSEFGYQSLPSTDSLRTVLGERDYNPTSPTMEHHQRNPGGNTRIVSRMADLFRTPFDFEDFLYLSQIQHGVAMETAIEHWRRRKPTTMGTLYWQLNVLWPCASWSSLEYDGKWKAQQYMARRQYAPLLISFHPTFEGADGGDNAQADDPDAAEWGDVEAQTLWLTSDVAEPLAGTVTLEVVDLTEDAVVHSERVDVALDAQASEPLETVSLADLPVDREAAMLRAEYDGDGDDVESYPAVAFFAEYKALSLPETDLDVRIDGATVTVASDAAALFVELDAGTLSGAFSDDYFHLAPGEERTVRFDSYDDRRPTVVESHLEDELSVRHLRETY